MKREKQAIAKEEKQQIANERAEAVSRMGQVTIKNKLKQTCNLLKVFATLVHNAYTGYMVDKFFWRMIDAGFLTEWNYCGALSATIIEKVVSKPLKPLKQFLDKRKKWNWTTGEQQKLFEWVPVHESINVTLNQCNNFNIFHEVYTFLFAILRKFLKPRSFSIFFGSFIIST